MTNRMSQRSAQRWSRRVMTDRLAFASTGATGPRVALLHGWGWDGRLLSPLVQDAG
jgi:hypothetical protein